MNAMDRGYGLVNPDENAEVSWGPVPIEDIGISTHPAKDQLQTLKARIFQGAKKVELGFMGRGKGSMAQGNTTPGMYDEGVRKDIKEMAEYNKVKLSTHVSPAISNLSGFTERGFSEEQREQALHEIKRTIDFAKDVTDGGAIVVHTGEFPRPFADAEWNLNGEQKFKMYEDEAKKAKQYVVDARTGEILAQFSRDQIVYEPKFLTAKDIEKDLGIKVVGRFSEKKQKVTGNGIIEPDDYVDMEGNWLDLKNQNDLFRRVPKWNSEKNQFEVEELKWEDFKKKADEWNSKYNDHKTPAQIYAETQLDNQILQHKGTSLFYAYDYDQMRENLKKAEEAYKYYKQLEANIPDEEKWKIAVQKHFGAGSEAAQLIPTTPKKPSEILDEYRKLLLKRMTHIHEASAAADAQARQILERRSHIDSLEDYAIKKSADTIARAAEEAMAKSEKLKNPLYIAPENIFPESYGSHPEELKKLILEARNKFAENLVKERHMSEDEARKLAERHIKATFDMGHAYIWRKYFKGSDEEFNKWLLKEVEDLADKKIIGHVHVADNFGYADEHVTPGKGKVPIKEIIEKLKEKGITDIIVEPAHQDFSALLGGWKLFGGRIYGVAPGVGGWSDIEHSYFGRNAPPYFLYGDAAPNAQEWSLWSQTKLE